MSDFTNSFLLLFVLLNPFIMSIYLLDLVNALDMKRFAVQLVRAGIISLTVFVVFAWAGEAIFKDVLQVSFIAFQIFGGVTFLIIGVRLILGIGPPVESPKDVEHESSAAIAMPFIVGPGTISASVLAGQQLGGVQGSIAIALALALMIIALIGFKRLHDYVRTRNERIIERYVEIVGRAGALFIGSFAIDMILTGISQWSKSAF